MEISAYNPSASKHPVSKSGTRSHGERTGGWGWGGRGHEVARHLRGTGLEEEPRSWKGISLVINAPSHPDLPGFSTESLKS